MKKILILANSSSGLYGFRNELVLNLLKEYEVYASLPDTTNNEELEKEGCRIIETRLNRRGMNPVQDFKLFLSYMKILSQIRPDAVLSYTIKPNIYGGMACRLKRIPYMVNITGLGSALENPGMLRKLAKILYKCGIKKASAVFLQNESNLQFFKDNKMTGSEMVLLPGSGVNTERFSYLPWPEGKTAFIFISRVMKEKGIEEYLACAKAIHEEHPEAEFHILGYCEEAYEDELKKLDSEGVISYHGSVKDVRPYIEQVKCIIHPSFYPEGMSNVCLESAACGRAVITTDKAGCLETVIDGKTGYVVPMKDKEKLTEAVRRFIALSEDEQREMGKAGREYVSERFDRRIVVDEYMKRLKKLGL
ncbi:MAG: glycosyltransferase family 4 protein [Lachnospiraceae bacterium]|nr:glycosyltransferase family 4 protein [Lachnospiraceae bacterium]